MSRSHLKGRWRSYADKRCSGSRYIVGRVGYIRSPTKIRLGIFPRGLATHAIYAIFSLRLFLPRVVFIAD